MADSLTTCEANLVNRLKAFAAAQTSGPLAPPLPLFEDVNVASPGDPPTPGYIQCWPFEDLGERKEASGGSTQYYASTWHWAATVCTPRNAGSGLATDWVEAIRGEYRGLQLGDLTVTAVDIVPVKIAPTDPYYQVQVIVRGDKYSDQAAVA